MVGWLTPRYSDASPTVYHRLAGVASELAAALCAEDVERLGLRRVDVAPYREYLRRLGAAGWGKADILSRIGVPVGNDHMYRDRCRYITPEVADRLEELFAEIGDRVGTNDLAARNWRKMGYQPPAAYDEDFTSLRRRGRES